MDGSGFADAEFVPAPVVLAEDAVADIQDANYQMHQARLAPSHVSELATALDQLTAALADLARTLAADTERKYQAHPAVAEALGEAFATFAVTAGDAQHTAQRIAQLLDGSAQLLAPRRAAPARSHFAATGDGARFEPAAPAAVPERATLGRSSVGAVEEPAPQQR